MYYISLLTEKLYQIGDELSINYYETLKTDSEKEHEKYEILCERAAELLIKKDKLLRQLNEYIAPEDIYGDISAKISELTKKPSK
jgi:hypothetical protein